MKKIIVICLISLLMITGCGNKEKENQELMDEVTKVYESYSYLDSLNEKNLKAHIGLSTDDVKNYIGVISEYEINDIYLVIEPKKGKEERVQKLVSDYINHYIVLLNDEINNTTDSELKSSKELLKKNYEEYVFEKVDGYYVYIIADENFRDNILKVIKDNL